MSMEDGLDKEGQEVLNELEKEGFEIAGREKPEAKSPDETKPEENKDKEEPKNEDKKQGQEPAGESDDKDKTKSEPDEDPKGTKTERKPQYVPLPKYLETENALKDAQKKIEELTAAGAKGTSTQQQVDAAEDSVKKLVELGYEEDEAKKIAKVIQAVVPGQALPKEVQEKLSQLDKLIEQTANNADKVAFESDFAKQVLKDFPHLEKYKEEIKAKAYTEEYKNTPLRTIAIEFMHDEGITAKPGAVKTVERSGGGSQKEATEINFDDITEEQFQQLTPEQMDKFNAYQEAKEKRARGALN